MLRVCVCLTVLLLCAGWDYVEHLTLGEESYRHACEKLRAEIKAVLPELKARFEQSGGNVIEMTPAETGAFIKAEYDAWTKVIKDAGLKLD